ncbi:hypothetical protein KSC_051220 [Ktedonobacter sp. SOSP1-52]|nr:hypothetical protein KSC_051220 [Ktedonobacter sp. SOSP1-52]
MNKGTNIVGNMLQKESLVQRLMYHTMQMANGPRSIPLFPFQFIQLLQVLWVEPLELKGTKVRKDMPVDHARGSPYRFVRGHEAEHDTATIW